MSTTRAVPPGKRLALFFDGTWNEPEDHTNVRRLRLMLADRDADGIPQRAFYDAGVGTRWYDRLSGGMFGAGLAANVAAGFQWLIENYDSGDEIYLFGFSRGAFTARSVAGLIARCGIPQPDSPLSFAQLFERYQRGTAARPIYDLIRDRANVAQFGFEDRALLRHSIYHRNLIKMVGVWDTVGSIGVPFGNVPGISRRTLRFHNTRLSRTAQHSYHALALDEYRSPYWAVLWTTFLPIVETAQAQPPDDRYVEQRWFSGAHGNVGGGYRDDPLPDRPLAWLQVKATACGLAFRRDARCDSADLATEPTNSYRQFLHGAWRFLTFGHRHVRPILAAPEQKQALGDGTDPPVAGWVQTVNERIDESVFERWNKDPNYRPPGIAAWAKSASLTVEDLIPGNAAFAQVTAAVTTPGIERRKAEEPK